MGTKQSLSRHYLYRLQDQTMARCISPSAILIQPEIGLWLLTYAGYRLRSCGDESLPPARSMPATHSSTPKESNQMKWILPSLVRKGSTCNSPASQWLFLKSHRWL